MEFVIIDNEKKINARILLRQEIVQRDDYIVRDLKEKILKIPNQSYPYFGKKRIESVMHHTDSIVTMAREIKDANA